MSTLPPPRTARRSLDNLAWALLAVTLGWLAQGLFAGNWLVEGLPLYAVAIPLFAVRLRQQREEASEISGQGLKGSSKPSGSALKFWGLPPLDMASGVRGGLGTGLIGGAVAASLASLWLFIQETRNAVAWPLYGLSLLLFGLGIWLVEPPARGDAPGNEKPVERMRRELGSLASRRPGVVLLVILALALFFRLAQFASLPFGTWYDEAEAGVQAVRILQEPAFRPVFWESINAPGHVLYLYALALWTFGTSTPALRVVSVLFGMGGVLFAYLFGREWRGRRWGWLLAFLVAVMRWDVNFSRIAMTGIDTPFFEFATLYFAMRMLHDKRGSMRPVAWAGLWLGLGACFYGAFRLFVAALVFFGVWCWPALADNLAVSLRALAPRLGLALAVAWLAAMPVAQFAVRHSDAFWLRLRLVSIFETRDDPDLVHALLQNTQKHLLMFNYQGDPNGRHNLPGAPTLDRLSAVLFALGLGLALARREPGDVFFLLLFVAGLTGGILSIDFEAPQSLRSIAALPAVVYFITRSLDALWLELKWAARVVRPRASLVPAALTLGLIAGGNGLTYFGDQAHNPTMWQAYSTAETLVGKRMAQLGPDPVYYLSPFFADHPSISFHAPPDALRSARKVMPMPDPLPAREPADRPVVYFIHPDEAWVFDLARQLYPAAQFEILPASGDFPPAVYVVQLKPSDIASLQGLDVRYWAGDDWTGQATPVASGRSPLLDLTWPSATSPALPFVAEWSGVLYAPAYGQYSLAVDAPGRVALTLDGETVEGSGALSLTPLLALGNHSLRLRAAGGQGRVRLTWQPPAGEPGTIPQWALYSLPVSAHGLLGKYYPNPDWQGTPAIERVDPLLDVYFHLTPLPRPYSVEWTGALDVPYGGVYGLGLRSVDQSRLYLDGQLVVAATQPNQTIENTVTMSVGLHALRVTFQDQTSRTRIHLYWTRPGNQQEIIPSSYLWPSRAGTLVPGPVAALDWAPTLSRP